LVLAQILAHFIGVSGKEFLVFGDWFVEDGHFRLIATAFFGYLGGVDGVAADGHSIRLSNIGVDFVPGCPIF
jgi:hypothetical protein